MKQTKLFQVTLTEADKAGWHALAAEKGQPYGVHFDTSGLAHVEPINPTASYSYVWRTDEEPAPAPRAPAPDRLTKPSAVRRFALTQARLTGRKFTRVSTDFLDAVEAAVRATVAARVHAAKGGKTL